MLHYYTLIVGFFSILFTLKIIYDTRGVFFFTGHNSSDNEKMVRMASEIRFWDWPSKMHSISYGRGQLREYWVLGLNLIRRFFKNKISDHLNIVLALFSNLISSILIYFIGSNYFSREVGFIVALFYITSFWSYEVAIFMGHIHLAQMFILFSIYFIQLTEAASFQHQLLLFFFAGLFYAISFASSSASRKYLPLALAALIYSLRHYLFLPWQENFIFFNQNKLIVFSALIFAILIFRFAILQKRHYLVMKVKKILKNDEPDEKITSELSKIAENIIWIVFPLGIFFIFFVKENIFYLHITAFCLGILLVILHLLLPFSNLVENLFRYYKYLYISDWGTHFKAYANVHDKIFGEKLPENFRGYGLPWIPRLLFRMIPVIVILYILSVLLIGVDQIWEIIQGNKDITVAGVEFLLLIGISLLPILTVEITRGLQVGKSYMPSIIGLLFLVGVALQIMLDFAKLNDNYLFLYWLIVLGVAVLQFIISARMFYLDILPARMAPRQLYEVLRKLKIKEFYTYNNPYNNSFVQTMLYTYPDEFNVHYIQSIEEVTEGIIVIPGTSSKSLSMETEKYAIEHGDFIYDELLNQLYIDRKIENLAIAKIKTMGSSKIFVHESEVTSYRDLILKQITEQDRWLGNAWVISALSIQDFKTNKIKV